MTNMEVDAHSSMYVAPLQVVKGSRSRRKSNGSNRSRRSSASNSARRRSQSKSKNASRISLASQETIQPSSESPRFESYLRAIHQFDPATYSDPSSVTMPLKLGDILLVHANHSNGWADGFLLSTGERGWVPTNFCVPLDQEPNRLLMRALTTFWDILHGGRSPITSILGNQDYMRGLVAGVRRTLEFTHCLNRESTLVQSHRMIRQYRKALLCDLSSLVKRSKYFQERIKENPDYEVLEVDFQDLVNRAFKMVMRAVRFVDVWLEDVDFGEKADYMMGSLNDHEDQDTKEDKMLAGNGETQVTANMTTRDSHQSIHESASHNQKRDSVDRPRLSRNSKTFVRPGATDIDSQSPQSPIKRDSRISIMHRSSISSRSLHARPACLASEKLLTAESHFLGLLGCFVGPHLQTRTSTDLLFATKGVLDACYELLAIIEAVECRQGASSSVLEQTRDRMYGVFAEFLQAARDMLRPESNEENDGASLDDLKRMGEAATSCVRCTGDCVATARSVIDLIGDFELEPMGLGLMSNNSAAMESSRIGLEEIAVDPNTITYFPLEPKSKPPPPPSSEFRPPSFLEPNFVKPDMELNRSSNLSEPQSQCSGFLPLLTATSGPLLSFDDFSPTSQISSNSVNSRVESIGVSSAGSGSTYVGSLRDSGRSGLSTTSTRATSPETLSPSFDDDCEAGEAKVMEKTYAHELMYNKDGQVVGGTLPALVECLTTYDSTPDVIFTSTFYLTFRLFTKPVDFAQALIDRFDYVSESLEIAGPVRLRVYNAFKHWLETHWRNDCDMPALTYILPFALGPLTATLPLAGKRLSELVDKVSSTNGLLVPRLISGMGKTNTAHALYVAPDTPLPLTIITKSQLTSLKNWKLHGMNLSILDFDPLELARQVTIKESRIFCSILPEELLASEWTKKTSSMAVNVRAMSTISTDLANFVADCILRMEDPNVRAKLVKQWIKIADKCLELNNYDSLIAIVCSLESATISRLKRTWDMVSAKTKAILENLRSVVELSRNYAVLRQRLQNHVPPCLPFVGIYLTDLTFVDIGNQPMRQLPGNGGEKCVEVINFDKHMKTAKIIGELQRFQIPYRLREQTDMQVWLQDQLIRVRAPDENTSNHFYRRSLLLEPRELQGSRGSDSSKGSSEARATKVDKTSSFSFKWASLHQKDRLKQEASLSRQTSLDEPPKSEQRSSGASNEHTTTRSTVS